MEQRHGGLGVGSRKQPSRDYLLHSSKTLFRKSYSVIRVTGVELPEEFLENRMRLLKGYSTLYIQVLLAIEHSKGQGQECRSR